LIKDGRDESFFFGNARTGKIVLVNSFVDYNKDADHRCDEDELGRSCDYVVKADLNPLTNQFLVCCRHSGCFQLFQYDDEDGNPEVVAGGRVEAYELNDERLRKACLINGVLCLVSRSVLMRTRLHYSLHRTYNTLEINMVDCTTGQVHPVISFMEGRYRICSSDVYSNSIMNGVSPLSLSEQTEGNYVYFCRPNVMIISDKESCLEITFYLAFDPKIGYELESKRVIKERETRKVMEIKENAAKKKKNKRAAQRLRKREEHKPKFVDKNTELQGIILSWVNSYGFIKVSKQEAKPLGNVFVHISDIENPTGRLHRRKVKFRIVSEPKGKMKAVDVKLLA
jgi:cold shock CspA family protein